MRRKRGFKIKEKAFFSIFNELALKEVKKKAFFSIFNELALKEVKQTFSDGESTALSK